MNYGTLLAKLGRMNSAVDNYDLRHQPRLTLFNRSRLTPTLAQPGTQNFDFDQEIEAEIATRKVELRFLEAQRAAIADLASEAPTNAAAFITWFEGLRDRGPGQWDPLFPWLAEEASLEEMKWFIGQEVAGEAGFDDLVALTQLRMPTPVKLELARNYWDEMGRGNERGMHGPMLAQLAKELENEHVGYEDVVPEALALGNLMVGLAYNRQYAFHSLGCLGVVELTAPDRARSVYQGLKRLGLSATAQRYYLLHSTLDVQHSRAWNNEAIKPLLESRPECATAIAEGALMRLSAGARCFKRYRRELGLEMEMAAVHAHVH